MAGGVPRTEAIEGTASPELYDPMAETSTPTGNMTATRWGHTATLLPNAEVFITAGSPLAMTAELYDPAAGVFIATGAPSHGLDLGGFPGTCGNGIIEAIEQCDDGNIQGGDGCSSACQVEANWACPEEGFPCVRVSRCGDGVVTSDEVCDDGTTAGEGGCAADCQRIRAGWECWAPGKARALAYPANAVCDGGYSQTHGCGNGVVGVGEECDDGPTNGVRYGQTGCTTACTKPHYCGDGIVDGNHGEVCDLGSRNGEQFCTSDCQLVIF